MLENNKWNDRKKKVFDKLGFLLQQMICQVSGSKLGAISPHKGHLAITRHSCLSQMGGQYHMGRVQGGCCIFNTQNSLQ